MNAAADTKPTLHSADPPPWRQQRALLDSLGQAVVGTDLEGNICYWNRAAEALYGWTAAEALGQPSLGLTAVDVPVDTADAIIRGIAAVGRWSGDVTGQRKDGATFPAVITVTLAVDETGEAIGSVQLHVDNTERMRAEQKLLHFSARLDVLHRLDRRILAAQSAEEIAEAALVAVDQLFPCLYASVTLFEFEREEGLVLACVGSARFATPRGSRISVTRESIPTPLLQGLDHIVADITAHPNPLGTIQALVDEGVRSLVTSPLMVEGELIGSLNLCSASVDGFPSDYLMLIRQVTDQVAIALQQARLYERVQRYAEELERRVDERTHELQVAKDRMEAILESASDGVILLDLLLDPEGTILRVNRAFEALFGYTPEEITGLSLAGLLLPESVPVVVRAMNDTSFERGERVEVRCLRRDGTIFDADMALSLIHEDVTGFRTLVCSCRDMTARKQMEEDLRRTLNRERELSELKARFISMVSHEFRTPLAIIQSATDLFKRYRDRLASDRQQQLLAEVQAQITNMTELLDDFLALSRAEVVGLQFNPTRMNPHVFCATLVQDAAQLHRMHHLIYNGDSACPDLLLDEKLMRQVMNNLIGNAAKYSAPGSTIRVDLACAKGAVTVKVRDEGIGIPVDDQRDLFELFHRARNVGAIHGTGLGLAIVKRAVEAHGGTIVVESIENVGTTFTITLPIKRGAPTADL